MASASPLASPEEIAAHLEANALIIDLRGEDECGDNAVTVEGAVNIVWDKSAGTMDTSGLPDDKSAPIVSPRVG